jgi:hypothetical protein
MADKQPPDRAEMHPLMRKPLDRGIGEPVQRKQHHLAPARAHRLGDRERNGAAAANDADRALAARRAHASSPPPARGWVMRRLPPARMKATIFCTFASSAKSRSIASTRSASDPPLKNSAR